MGEAREALPGSIYSLGPGFRRGDETETTARYPSAFSLAFHSSMLLPAWIMIHF